MVALTRQAGKVQQECGLDILPDEFVRSVLKWGLMEVCAAFRLKTTGLLVLQQYHVTKAPRCCYCTTMLLLHHDVATVP